MSYLSRFLSVVERFCQGATRRLRNAYYRCRFKRMGRGCNLCSGVLIFGAENISLGHSVNINHGCVLQSSYGAEIEVGDRVTLSYQSMILTGGYDLGQGRASRAHEIAAVRIGDGAWIGARAIILPGVTVGENAVVAAGAVVVHDVSAETVVAGVPAQAMRSRNG